VYGELKRIVAASELRPGASAAVSDSTHPALEQWESPVRRVRAQAAGSAAPAAETARSLRDAVAGAGLHDTLANGRYASATATGLTTRSDSQAERQSHDAFARSGRSGSVTARLRFGRDGRALPRPPRAPAPPGEAGTPPSDRALPRSHASSHDSTRSAPPLAAAVGTISAATQPRAAVPLWSESGRRGASRSPLARTRNVAKTVGAAPDGRMTKAIPQSGGSRRS
jgi:hypothetical protein